MKFVCLRMFWYLFSIFFSSAVCDYLFVWWFDVVAWTFFFAFYALNQPSTYLSRNRLGKICIRVFSPNIIHKFLAIPRAREKFILINPISRFSINFTHSLDRSSSTAQMFLKRIRLFLRPFNAVISIYSCVYVYACGALRVRIYLCAFIVCPCWWLLTSIGQERERNGFIIICIWWSAVLYFVRELIRT